MKFKYFLVVFLTLVILLLPWVHGSRDNLDKVPPVSQEDLSFYEINPCKVSFLSFLISNPKSIYQDHYFFRPNDYSSIACFGKISGVTHLQNSEGSKFYISIGTNSLINILYQSLIWFLIISLIPKNKKILKLKLKNYTAIGISAYLFTFSIYAEQRFYEKSLYLFNISEKKNSFLIYLIFYLIFLYIYMWYETREKIMINYLPFIFLFTGIFSGFNLTFFSLIFIFLGIKAVLNNDINKNFIKSYSFLAFFWLVNSHGSYFFKVGKLRGFSSSIYEFNANLFWILYFYLLLIGIHSFFKENKFYFKLQIFSLNMSITATLLIVIGYIASVFPVVNFLTYYYFGLQRYVIEGTSPFSYDEYFVKVSWRGMSQSSETIGEFYALVLLIILFQIVKYNNIRKIDKIGVVFSGLGLYFSDNKTSIFLIFVIVFLYLFVFQNFQFSEKILKRLFSVLISFPFFAWFWLSSVSTLNSIIEFLSTTLVSKAKDFQVFEMKSSFLNTIESFLANSNVNIFKYFVSFMSAISFILNRSERWGLFFARYNPTFLEFLIGSGPLNFGQLYGEVPIQPTSSLFLPHSTLLSYLLFLGIVPLLALLIYVFKLIFNNLKNIEFVLFSFFVLINLLKNDSMNYFSNFVLYILLFLILKNREEVFENRV